MTTWAAYEACGTCRALAGAPCRQRSNLAAEVAHGQLRVMARRLAKPHRGRVRNPGRVGVLAAGSRIGGYTTPSRGLDWTSGDRA